MCKQTQVFDKKVGLRVKQFLYVVEHVIPHPKKEKNPPTSDTNLLQFENIHIQHASIR
jgi:hypothetical protein